MPEGSREDLSRRVSARPRDPALRIVSNAVSDRIVVGVVAALGVALLSGCGGAPSSPGTPSSSNLALAVVAEGPCARLSMEPVGKARYLVYGDTGYELGDWQAGEQLAAAQTVAELTAEGWVRDPHFVEGLPLDARGYVPGSLTLGVDSRRKPWLHRTSTRYAARGTGSLLERDIDAFRASERGWIASDDATRFDMGLAAREVPEVPTREACDDERLHFVPLSSSLAADGTVFVAGRCQDGGRIAYAETALVVAHLPPDAKTWTWNRLPHSTRLDGIVNVDVFGRSRAEAWFVAFEPFGAIDGRQSYLMKWDGRAWTEENVDVDEGLMSIAGDAEGRLYLAGGRALYRRETDGRIGKLTLPPLRFTASQPELHVHHVTVDATDALWVEASYRVRIPTDERGTKSDVWASALFSNARVSGSLYCDAAELAERALAEVEGVK